MTQQTDLCRVASGDARHHDEGRRLMQWQKQARDRQRKQGGPASRT